MTMTELRKPLGYVPFAGLLDMIARKDLRPEVKVVEDDPGVGEGGEQADDIMVVVPAPGRIDMACVGGAYSGTARCRRTLGHCQHHKVGEACVSAPEPTDVLISIGVADWHAAKLVGLGLVLHAQTQAEFEAAKTLGLERAKAFHRRTNGLRQVESDMVDLGTPIFGKGPQSEVWIWEAVGGMMDEGFRLVEAKLFRPYCEPGQKQKSTQVQLIHRHPTADRSCIDPRRMKWGPEVTILLKDRRYGFFFAWADPTFEDEAVGGKYTRLSLVCQGANSKAPPKWTLRFAGGLLGLEPYRRD